MSTEDLNDKEKAFWNEYLRSIPPSLWPSNADIEASYAGNREVTDKLLALYQSGKKAAASSLVKAFEVDGEPLPAVGAYWIVLNGQGHPACILKTVRVDINRFSDVPAEVAIAEGEGDCSISDWKRLHRKFYTPYLDELGIQDLDAADVITEFFEMVYKA